MRARCNNPNHTAYHRYGGRGITVCAAWQDSFEAFLANMGERPSGTSLDRIDTNGNYEPSNCRWATAKEQARNCRSNRNLTFQGETLPVSQWAERASLSPRALTWRLNNGWPVEEALARRPSLVSRKAAAAARVARGAQ